MSIMKPVKKKKKNIIRRAAQMKPSRIIPLGFMSLILLGALLLMLPIATTSGEVPEFSTALFTSTTSVCVTGSVVVDTYSYWSLFGHIVILLLIQLGGLGIVAVISMVIIATEKRRKNFYGMMLLKDSFNLESMRGVRPFIARVFKGTLTVEAIGALGYFFAFIPQFGWVKGIWYSFFTSVSAFCNAGIDIIGPDSLTQYYDKPAVLITTMFLIVAGGIGYVVWFDLGLTRRVFYKQRKDSPTSGEHTKLVLIITAVLIVFGTIMTLALEWDNPKTIGNMNVGEKVMNSMFQSVTYRTAGFTTFSQADMHQSTSVIGDILMFIGGSPVGTAGGVKTITMFVVVANLGTFLRGKYEITVFGRRISDDMVRKAMAIVTMHLFTLFTLTAALIITEKVLLADALYEVMSALCTVGLSRGLTPDLHLAGRIILIIAMILGRIGPISMALFFKTGPGSSNNVRPAKGRFIIG